MTQAICWGRKRKQFDSSPLSSQPKCLHK